MARNREELTRKGWLNVKIFGEGVLCLQKKANPSNAVTEHDLTSNTRASLCRKVLSVD